jgi:hypothetical protein
MYRAGEVKRDDRGNVKTIKYHTYRNPSSPYELMVQKGVSKIRELGRKERDNLIHWTFKTSETKK